jgi:hypothetical protein
LLFACWAIVVILGAMAIVFLRKDRRGFAKAVLPLMLPPFIYILSGVAARQIDRVLPYNAYEIMAMLNMLAGLVSCVLLGFTSRHIEGKRTRRGFIIGCSLFIIILTGALVMDTLQM